MERSTNSIIIPNQERDSDERGSILSIVDACVMNVSIISCKAGSIRSNHYHHEDYHYMYVLSGKIDYFYKMPGDEKLNYLYVRKGDTIFTPAKEWHATFFPINTELIVSSKNPRDQETYEKDTVRNVLIDQNNVHELLRQFRNEK